MMNANVANLTERKETKELNETQKIKSMAQKKEDGYAGLFTSDLLYKIIMLILAVVSVVLFVDRRMSAIEFQQKLDQRDVAETNKRLDELQKRQDEWFKKADSKLDMIKDLATYNTGVTDSGDKGR